MGPGFLDGVFETLAWFVVVLLVIAFAAGYGCSRGCDYVKAHYTVKVEKKP